jgi:predicted TIM-barrel fold metal-dependent hydrolase
MPARKFPDLTIVLGHAGGGLYAAEAVVAATVCPNIYVELSSLMPHHMREVFAHVPPSRLMIGTDVPESSEAELVKVLAYDMPDDSRRDILWRTARKVFDAEAD